MKLGVPILAFGMLSSALLLGCGGSTAEPTGGGTPGGPMTADQALAMLHEGNARFVRRPASVPNPTRHERTETANHQEPFALIVGCADSRTGPEIVFDQSIGDLFVVRVAGNVIDDFALGSIEYAVEHLGTRLIVVMGHERCGAVTAAMDDEDAPGYIGSLVRAIRPAVEASKGREGDPLENAVVENAARAAEEIRSKAHLTADTRVVTAYYDLDTGVVRFD
ncbi:MAG: carbonic anhydrase [Chthonomonas sp.]